MYRGVSTGSHVEGKGGIEKIELFCGWYDLVKDFMTQIKLFYKRKRKNRYVDIPFLQVILPSICEVDKF